MKRRWNNIFRKDNRAFVLAMDHAMVMEVCSQGLRDPGYVISSAVEGGVDAILTTYGVAKHFGDHIGNRGLILRVDGGTTQLHPSGYCVKDLSRTFSVEDAIRVGADGVMSLGFPGLENEKDMVRQLSETASECDRWGVVFGAEMIPGGFVNDDIKTLDNIALCARIGAEYGADFIKAPFMGDSKSYRQVIESCYKPVLVLGGDSSREDRDLLAMVKEAMNAGASGAVIGRNIWRHENIGKICSAISKVIHEDASVDQALEELK